MEADIKGFIGGNGGCMGLIFDDIVVGKRVHYLAFYIGEKLEAE